MKNKKALVLIMVMILPIFIINSYEIDAISSPPAGGENKINTISEGVLAPDFNITDVDSLIEYKLSDFQGKIVMIDLFATWCGPCIAALPIIRELYLMYTEDMFQIISIDVDTSETVAQISGFKASHNMDWIVGSDINGTIDEDLNYGSGFIPTMYLINETGHVIYAEVGFDEITVRGILGSLLPDDTTTPYYEEISFYNNTELSIFNPRFEIFANISEDRYLQTIEVRIVNDGIETYALSAEKVNGFYIIDQGIPLDSLFLYPLATLELQIYVKDYFNNANLTSVIYLPVTQYVDAGPPVISNTAVEWSEVSETRYNVTVYAIIEEDLLFMKKDVWFMEGVTIKKAATFDDFNGTHMVASAELLYTLANPWDLTAHIIVRDVAGNEVTEDLAVADLPTTTTPTPTETEESSYFLFIPLLSVIAIVSVAQTFRKRK